jgi:adenylate cyclase
MDKAPHWRLTADPLTEEAKPTFAAVREDLARVPLARRIVTVVFILLAIWVARDSWDMKFFGRSIPAVTPFMRDSERAAFDMRALSASLRKPVEQDQRIVLVPFTPDTQRATGERSPLDRTTLANALTAIDKMASTIAIITRTPKHYFYSQGGDPSSEALIAMEAPLNQ